MSKSFIIYIHNDLSGDTNWKKIGKAMTPYSAVRSRQKNCSQKFYLNHIFFGDPEHINILEETFKKTCYRLSGTYLNKISGQTELFKMPEEEILIHLLGIIEQYNLNVKKIDLDGPYFACNSGECPLQIPSENYSYAYLRNLVIKTWGTCSNIKSKNDVRSDNLFSLFFELT